MRFSNPIIITLILLTLAACGRSPDSRQPTSPSSAPLDRFSLAKGCYGLQAVATGNFVVTNGAGYTANSADVNTAEAFFMQAATLGKYLFFATDERLLTAGANVTGSTTPSDAAIWTIDFDATAEVFSINSDTTNQFLAVDANGNLTTRASAGPDTQFRFVATTKICAQYPEMPLGVIGDTYKGNGVDQPIIGFADVHTHQGMSSEMSYAGDVGPSAGGVLYGEVFHRFGVKHALEDCADFHGPNGARDANNILAVSPTSTHDTQGWPTFVDWPAPNALTHQVMYYRWVERAWLSGLRVMVNHGTNIAALCRIGQQYSTKSEADCDDMSVGVKQLEYLYEVQDYIDAQHGGPGKGWYRIVKSPQEARAVINDGKLAVILGLEFAQILDCGVTFNPDGTETRNCDEAQIDAELERMWNLGVRHIYPYHDIDSSLGGTGLFSDILNYLNFLDTGRYWETEDCRAYPEDEPFVREPGTEINSSVPGTGNDPVSQQIIGGLGGTAPIYTAGRHCNRRHVTDLGDYALRAMMSRKFIIDIDHAAYHSKDIMLDIADEQNPPYPMASSHDAHGGLTSDQAVRMLAAGGTIYPYKGNGIKHTEFLQDVKFWRNKAAQIDGSLATASPLGLGYGADGNGFGGHPGPRGGDSELIQYPITLFQGTGWGPQFDNIQPIQVDMLTIPESGKFWNIDEVGMAHYGLVADFVEEVRLEGGQEGLDALFNSAEAFVQMWERVYNR